MIRFQTFVLRHPIWFSLAVTIAFMVFLILPELAVRNKPDDIQEMAGAIERVVIGALAYALALTLGWRESAGFSRPGTATSWALIAGPLLYLGSVFPFVFTGTWGPNLRDPRLTALVAADAFAAGAMEELVFRGLIFFAFVQAWGRTRGALVRAGVMSSLFFSLPHLTNVFFGQRLLRVLSQLGWSFILGIAVAWLAYAGASLWPVAFLHGTLNMIVATNRMGMHIEFTPFKGMVMLLLSLPVFVYGCVVLWRTPRAAVA